VKPFGERDLEKENTNTDILQNNVLNQTYTNSNNNNANTHTDSARTKRKDNSRGFNSRTTVIQNANIPKFYYPMGKPSEKDTTDEVLLRVSQEFSKLDKEQAGKHDMAIITKVKTCLLLL